MARLRIGIVGGGIMGARHAETVARRDDAAVVAVADPFSDRLATALGVDHHNDHGTLLARGDVDAVIVANPNAEHVPCALDCLDAGVPSLLEKPVATSVEQAEVLSQAVAESGGRVLVGHHRRHHPAVAAARDFLRDGGIGDLVAINGTWLTRKADSYFEAEWHRKPGAGAMLINVIHDLDMLRHLCGEITSVQAITSSRVRGLEVEDTASLTLTFADGALGSFVASDAVVAPWGWDQATEDDPAFPYVPGLSCYTVSGTRGSLSVPDLRHYHHLGPSDWTRPLAQGYLPRGTGDSYVRQLAHFMDVVRGTVDPLVTVADAATTLALVDAAHQAADSGRRTSVPVSQR